MKRWSTAQEGKLKVLLESGLTGQKEALTILYKDAGLRKLIFSFLLKRGATNSECDMIFSDALIAFVKKGGSANFEFPDKLGSYLLGIAKFLFFRIKRTEKRTEALEIDENKEETDSPEVVFLGKEKRQQIFFLLNALDEACRETILLWTREYSMKEIAETLGYKTAGVVRKKKHLCLKKLMGILQKKPQLRQRLLELHHG